MIAKPLDDEVVEDVGDTRAKDPEANHQADQGSAVVADAGYALVVSDCCKHEKCDPDLVGREGGGINGQAAEEPPRVHE